MDENPQTSGAPSSDATAAHLAMGNNLSEEARDYLREQTALSREQIDLTRLQKQNLIEQNAFELSHLHWRRISEHLSGVLQIFLLLIGFLVVIGIGMAIWNAANDNGLTIDAFNVPPDLAQKGLTGEVVANKLLDRLADYQRQTVSNRSASSYTNNWGDDIKVQIPNTGISIGEANRYLHQWLGHGTRISGDVYRMADGKIAVIARAGVQTSPTFTGNEADLDKLLNKAAEAVYRVTQPYRYGSYLSQHGRSKEATAIYRDLVENGPRTEKLWGHIGLRWEADLQNRADIAAQEMYAAIALKPDFAIAWVNLASDEGNLLHEEEELKAARGALRLDNGDRSVSARRLVQYRQFTKADIASVLGDWQGAEQAERDSIVAGPSHDTVENDAEGSRERLQSICGALHDAGCLRDITAALPATTDRLSLLFRKASLASAQFAMGWYSQALAALQDAKTGFARDPSAGLILSRVIYPLLAVTSAHLGDVKAAHRWIDKTPLDCSQCLRNRGTIDSLEGNWGGADYWFARAVKAAPSIPFNDTDWGAALLRKKDYDGAIRKFASAHQKGPHFADPLEMWGEALIAKNRSDLALTKFVEAAKYAPNWGRLHLKWGEALLWSGDHNGAKAQFAAARMLYLADAEKRALKQASQAH